MKDIIHKVRRVQQRMVVNRFLDAWAVCLLFCASALVLYLLVDKVVFIGIDPLVPLAGALGLSVLLAAAFTWLRHPRFLSAAILADEHMGLKERVSSVLAIDRFETEMERALYADTMERVQRLSLADAAPIEIPRRMRWVPVPVVAALVCLFLPNWDVLQRRVAHEKQESTLAEVKKRGEELKKKSEELKEKAKGQEMKEAARIANEFEKLSEEMKKGIPKKEDAMAKLSSLADQVRQRQDQLADKKGQANDLKSALGKNDDGKTPSEMEKKLSEGKFGEVAKDLEQKMKDLQDGKLSEEQKQQLAKDLQSLAKSMKDMPSVKSLQKAAQSAGEEMQSMDPKDMQDAMKNMGDLGQQLGDIGKAEEESKMLSDALNELQKAQDQLGQQGDQGTCPNCGQKLAQGQSQDDHEKGGG